jgi:small subunit ribosomal protein S4e
MHLKRKTIGKFWPVPKTGTKYLAVPSHSKENSIPLIVVMRDLLGFVKIKKELKKLIHEKKIMVNGKIVKEINYPLGLFDCISIPSISKHYRIILNGKRFYVQEAKESELSKRIYKIIGKKILPKNKVQINLSNGKNLLSNEKVKTGEFIVLDNKNKILKVIEIKKDSEVIAFKGKHIGIGGKIKEIIQEGENKIALIKTKEGEIKANLENLFLTE